jgi:ribosome-binding protein aMBF1 (putative translation factor)
MSMTKRPHIADRPERAPVRLRALRQSRPTKPASEFSEAMTREAAARNRPDQEAWATRAGIERAAELMREARTAMGLSQQQFAEIAHTSQSVISDIERGAGSFGPSFSVLFRILNAHGFDLKVTPQTRSEQPGRLTNAG